MQEFLPPSISSFLHCIIHFHHTSKMNSNPPVDAGSSHESQSINSTSVLTSNGNDDDPSIGKSIVDSNAVTEPGLVMMQHIHSTSTLMTKLSGNETPGCTCKKSRCLKLYCQCFAASALCDSTKCRCESCKNEVSREKDIKRARSNVLYRNPRAFEDKFTNAIAAASNTNNARKLPSIRRNFSAMRNPIGKLTSFHTHRCIPNYTS